ncbi:MAG TPA: UvrD-helicase domain-containing protein, partial [Telluria sp.]
MSAATAISIAADRAADPVPVPDRVPDPFEKLNAEQRAAVEHDVGEAFVRPLLVVAGAGSGKTNTLAHRVAR